MEAAPEEGTPGSPDAAAVAQISPHTPPMSTSGSLAEEPQLASNDYDEAGKAVQFNDGSESDGSSK